MKQNRVVLDLRGAGTVPFDVGGYGVDDLARLRVALERPRALGRAAIVRSGPSVGAA